MLPVVADSIFWVTDGSISMSMSTLSSAGMRPYASIRSCFCPLGRLSVSISGRRRGSDRCRDASTLGYRCMVRCMSYRIEIVVEAMGLGLVVRARAPLTRNFFAIFPHDVADAESGIERLGF